MSGCYGSPTESYHNVVLICLDTVRADHLGAYGYEDRVTTPTLDRLAARSLVFEDVSATSGWTKPSVPSIFTGTYPAQHGVYEGSARRRLGRATDLLPEQSVTLAEVFLERGFRTAAFVRNAHLRQGNGFEQGFTTYEDDVGDAESIRVAATDWLDSLSGDSPFFLYLHFLDAHWPYPIPEVYATRFIDAEAIAQFRTDDWRGLRDAINSGERPFEDSDRAALEALYDGAIRYIDDELAAFFVALAERQLDEDTVIAVIADHGEEFGENGRIGHGHSLSENLLRVPWILSVPGSRKSRSGNPVSLVDVFPTLLAAAGVDPGDSAEGVNRMESPEASKAILAEHKSKDRYLQSLRQGPWKLVREFVPRADPETEKLRIPIEVGGRWEAEIRDGGGELLIADQLKSRTESPDDPLEVKGVISGLSAARFQLGPFQVRWSEQTLLVLTDGVADSSLANGVLVKVTGPSSDRELIAERIKVYQRGEEPQLEIRGPVSAVEGTVVNGRVRLGDCWVMLDSRTRFKGVDSGSLQKLRMERHQILGILENGSQISSQNPYQMKQSLFKVINGLEQLENGEPARGRQMSREIDRIGKDLTSRRSFGERDRQILTTEAIRQLRALGYLE